MHEVFVRTCFNSPRNTWVWMNLCNYCVYECVMYFKTGFCFSPVRMIWFCPFCSNSLSIEEGKHGIYRFCCGTCPYVHNVVRKMGSRRYPKLKVNNECVVISVGLLLIRKLMMSWEAPVLGRMLIQLQRLAQNVAMEEPTLCSSKQGLQMNQWRLSISVVNRLVDIGGENELLERSCISVIKL